MGTVKLGLSSFDVFAIFAILVSLLVVTLVLIGS